MAEDGAKMALPSRLGAQTCAPTGRQCTNPPINPEWAVTCVPLGAHVARTAFQTVPLKRLATVRLAMETWRTRECLRQGAARLYSRAPSLKLRTACHRDSQQFRNTIGGQMSYGVVAIY